MPELGRVWSFKNGKRAGPCLLFCFAGLILLALYRQSGRNPPQNSGPTTRPDPRRFRCIWDRAAWAWALVCLSRGSWRGHPSTRPHPLAQTATTRPAVQKGPPTFLVLLQWSTNRSSSTAGLSLRHSAGCGDLIRWKPRPRVTSDQASPELASGRVHAGDFSVFPAGSGTFPPL